MGKHKDKRKKNKHKKDHKERRKRSKSSSDSSSSSEEVWVEKADVPLGKDHGDTTRIASEHDDWLSLSTSITSSSNIDHRIEREEKRKLAIEESRYNPRSNIRELNPYWKDGGDGLPKFKKPTDDNYANSYSRASTSKWRKEDSNRSAHRISNEVASNTPNEAHSGEVLSEKELNVLAAKLVKAEIMGNTSLAARLKEQLDQARDKRKHDALNKQEDDGGVILTTTDSKGYSIPVKMQSKSEDGARGKKKKQKVETHQAGERIRYFAGDDKYTLKQMFEEEKFSSADDQNRQFLKLAGKTRKNDDMDDVFTDDIRNVDSAEKIDRRNRDRAIKEHEKVSQSLDGCRRCLQSTETPKHLMVTLGETMYLTLPHFEPLSEGHCFIVPIRHVPCARQLDENEWAELLQFNKSLCRMFESQNKSVIFFETAMSLRRFPHTVIECVPLPNEQGDLAPMYFKKAIDESETEWASNKKLISMAGPDVRRAVPKGLSYFSVSFGMTTGFAHVIEDEQYFPRNFAQEIIGGMMELSHDRWMKPRAENFDEQSRRVCDFSKMWSKYDCTSE